METKKKIRIGISKRVIIGTVILSFAIALFLGIVGYLQQKDSIMQLYNQNGYVVGDMILSQIDHDKVAKYARDWEADDYYYEMSDYLDTITEASGAAYIYIIVPAEDCKSMRYIYDSSGMNLGDVDPMSDTKENPRTVFNAGERSKSYFVRKSQKYGYLTSSILPVFDSANNVCAVLLVDTHMEILVAKLTAYLIKLVVICLLSIVVFSTAYLSHMRKRIVYPINFIGRKAKEFSQNAGTVTEELKDIKTNDELEDLAGSILGMERDIIRHVDNLTKITAEKERIGAELNVAKKIQADALPSIFPAFPERTEIDIYATMNPAKEVGGDFYDFFLIDDNHIGMVMADVSGKGVPAALFMMISKTLIKNQAQFTKSPAEILRLVNEQLCQNNTADMFVTVWMGILELSTGLVTAANAGHEFPVIKRNGGDYELFKDKHGFVLGGMDGVRFKEYEIQLEKGDQIFVYTDGVAEATNVNNELFGTDRMLASLNANKDRTLIQLLPSLREDIDRFVGEAPQFDDITMLVVEYRGKDL